MAEGGLLPWKVQEVDESRGPSVSYDHISRREPLPALPVGSIWVKDEETREWRVVKAGSSASRAVDDAIGKEAKDAPGGSEDEPVEGVDYLVHTVLPTDTFSGLCLRYRINAVQLRQANKFSGTNLKLAPSRLVIPLNKEKMKARQIKVQDSEKS